MAGRGADPPARRLPVPGTPHLPGPGPPPPRARDPSAPGAEDPRGRGRAGHRRSAATQVCGVRALAVACSGGGGWGDESGNPRTRD